ncbi:MAG: adenylate/guanylate cyclase domain-containing protein [Deltaproteobacteria bacterium]|nr:adenylate/guanylate cyclase domain-containing protein [Deltaproteobacteria bacterium]
MKYIRIAGLLGLSLLLLYTYFSPNVYLTKILSGLEDTKFAIRKKLDKEPLPREDVLVVTIDEKSVNKLGRWPWNREVVGQLIGNLSEASIVSLDIVFSEKTTEEEDRALGDQIADNENVILGFFFRFDASQVITEEALSYLEDCTVIRYKQLSNSIGLDDYPFAEANIPAIAEGGLSCAPFNTKPDVDGLFRNYPLIWLYKGYIFPSLGLQTVRYHLNKDINLELDEDGINKFTLGELTLTDTNFLRVNFHKHVNEISALDVIEGTVDPSYFEKKIVLIGPTEIGIYDVRPTPIDTLTPGVYLHYNAVLNLLDRSFLKHSKAIDLSLIIAAIIFSGLASLLRSVTLRVILYGLIVAAIFTVVNALFILEAMWLNLSMPLLSALLIASLSELLTYLKSETQTTEIKKAFSSYVSPDIVKNIIKNPDSLKLGGEEREITVLFSDIRDFTSISERLTPTQLVYLLNSLLDPLTETILNKGGLLDKYIGDAIMALFNAPLTMEDHADKAVLSSIEMIRKIEEVNRRMEEEGIPSVKIGIGIHTGIATVGNMGSKLRFDYTAIGDTVNLSSRLEGLTKIYDVHIIMSEATKNKLKREYLTRKIDVVKVKGKNEPITIYHVMDNTEQNRKIKAGFDAAMGCYYERRFEEAKKLFNAQLNNYNDMTSSVFIKRCIHYINEAPGESWDGVFTHVNK